ncbi:MAG TPA: hypothetical protein EYP19_00040 [Desulfobacterales bacterium]|nr:hypothetical protein [Desulfobacterales bacterium]
MAGQMPMTRKLADPLNRMFIRFLREVEFMTVDIETWRSTFEEILDTFREDFAESLSESNYLESFEPSFKESVDALDTFLKKRGFSRVMTYRPTRLFAWFDPTSLKGLEGADIGLCFLFVVARYWEGTFRHICQFQHWGFAAEGEGEELDYWMRGFRRLTWDKLCEVFEFLATDGTEYAVSSITEREAESDTFRGVVGVLSIGFYIWKG